MARTQLNVLAACASKYIGGGTFSSLLYWVVPGIGVAFFVCPHFSLDESDGILEGALVFHNPVRPADCCPLQF